MKPILIHILFFAGIVFGCTNSESEEIIEGQWQGKVIQESTENRTHALPGGITLDFEYPKYSFDGEQSEAGNYYIKDEKLHLIPDNQDEKREIDIIQLSPDSLALKLVDTLGSRTVLFLRN